MKRTKGMGRWYELTDVFDPHESESLPFAGGFLRGDVDGMLVVTVPKAAPYEEIEPLIDHLVRLRQSAPGGFIIVREGVRFLKLRVVGKEAARVLDTKAQEQRGAGGADHA